MGSYQEMSPSMLLVHHVVSSGGGMLGAAQYLLASRCVQGSRRVETTLTCKEPGKYFKRQRNSSRNMGCGLSVSYNSIQWFLHLFVCLPKNPKTNYFINKHEHIWKQTHTHKRRQTQKKKNLHNNENSIKANAPAIIVLGKNMFIRVHTFI
jgi:hypothetical protein